MKEEIRTALFGAMVLSVIAWLSGFSVFYWIAVIWILIEVLD